MTPAELLALLKQWTPAELAEFRSLLFLTGEINLVSPNGQHLVTLRADNDGAGVWVTNKDQQNPFVALTEGYNQGATVGVWADHHRTQATATDLALGASEQGVQIQFTDKTNQVYEIDSEQLRALTQLKPKPV